MHLRSSGLLTTLLGLTLSFPALAFHPLITDDAGTQGAGVNQFETGYDYTRSKVGGVTDTERGVPFAYTRGITENFDLAIAVPYLRVGSTGAATESGTGNVELGAKWSFYNDEANKCSYAVSFDVALPVSGAKAARGLGDDKTVYGLTGILTQETHFGSFNVNVAYEHNRNNAGRENLFRLSAAPAWQLNEQWVLALDAGLQTNPDVAEDRWMGFTEVGVVYTPSEAMDISFGVIRELMDGPVSTTTATLGLTFHF